MRHQSGDKHHGPDEVMEETTLETHQALLLSTKFIGFIMNIGQDVSYTSTIVTGKTRTSRRLFGVIPFIARK
jgi:hypothetical protein